MRYISKILEIREVTHDVKCFRIEKPTGYTFIPGQATDVSVNEEAWLKEKRPFTFTSLNEYPYLEFTIKRYSSHTGVTDRIHRLKEGDELVIRDVWGAISYKGPGYFIAGGAGITPFMAILRQLHHDHSLSGVRLFFTNKTSRDIIYESELSYMLGQNVTNILSDTIHAQNSRYLYGRINENFLKREITDFSKHFYVCGPDQMITDINAILLKQGIKSESLVFEQ